MSRPTYLFYDLETTGLNYAFDQVLQFAGIRTDLSFSELERHEILVKLRPDVIPSPAAMMAHKISLSDNVSAIFEYEATRQIHALLNEPGTVSIGFNSLGFDDEFLRFAFYRNLLPPYTHQHANNCWRMDLLPIVTLYWLYKPDVLKWPWIDDKASLKLEHLNAANNLADAASHDAMADVQASVELARRLSAEKEMWDYAAGYFKKGLDSARQDELQPLSKSLQEVYRFGLLVDVGIGSQYNYQAPVLFIGQSEPYSNQFLWLRLDRPELQETTADNIEDTTWVIRKKQGQKRIILPPKERFLQRLDSERRQILADNRRWLEAHPDLLVAIAKYHREFTYQEVPNVDVDALLYQTNFLTDEEAEVSRRFHNAALSQKAGMLGLFRRSDLRQLAERIIFRNYPDRMPDSSKPASEAFMKQVNPSDEEQAMVDYRGKRRMTPRRAISEIEALRSGGELSAQQSLILDELAGYLRSRFPEAN